ncbi:MAG TPA: hypothetical protein VFF26_11055 [Gallionella sp.]|nr:hypothetical protein [Gallionella sp.]
MLSNLFGKKSDHPMADMKSAQALLGDLPRNDPHKMVMELTEWMESVGDNTDFKLDHQFAVLRLLDETAQPFVRKLAREYFVPNKLDRFQENRLWLLLGNWSHHAANAYMAVFDRYCNGDKGAGAIKALMPLLAVRALHALTAWLKYISAHYGPLDPALWGMVARIAHHAEQNQYLDARVELYPGAADSATARCELARMLGWYGCGIGALSPLYMHLTERIVGQYCASVTFAPQQSADSLFCFDLDHPAAPLRVKAGAHVQPSTRFVGMAGMQSQLEGVLKELEKNTVPQELNLGGSYAAEVVREAAQYLLDYLTDPPLRRSPRRGIKVNLKVANGFGRLLENTDVGLNFNAEQLHWEIEDISASGFRTVIPSQGADGIRIGSLLGIQPDGVSHWGAAVVRRLMRDDANRLHVGAEMLSNQLAGVTLGGPSRDDGVYALWLMVKPGEPVGEVRLLMKADTFSAQRSQQVSLGDKRYLLMPIGLDEKGDDYDLARFRAIEQEAGED